MSRPCGGCGEWLDWGETCEQCGILEGGRAVSLPECNGKNIHTCTMCGDTVDTHWQDAKLSAREKRMREVAEEIDHYIGTAPTEKGMWSLFNELPEWRTKLLEGLES